MTAQPADLTTVPAGEPLAAQRRWTRRGIRAAAVLGGALAAVVLWAIGKYLFDVEMRVRLGPGATETSDLGVGPLVVTVLGWTLAGWGLLAILERFVARARTIWTWLAIAGTVLSLASPLFSPDISPGTRATLSVMHLAVGAVVIPVLARTSHRR